MIMNSAKEDLKKESWSLVTVGYGSIGDKEDIRWGGGDLDIQSKKGGEKELSSMAQFLVRRSPFPGTRRDEKLGNHHFKGTPANKKKRRACYVSAEKKVEKSACHWRPIGKEGKQQLKKTGRRGTGEECQP